MDALVEVARVFKVSGVKNHTSPPRAGRLLSCTICAFCVGMKMERKVHDFL
jgi:hypothetical protein